MHIKPPTIKQIIKWLLVAVIGIALGCAYSYIIKESFSKQTIIVFFCLYVYIIVFIKFLIRLFK